MINPWKVTAFAVTAAFATYVAATNVPAAVADQPQMHEALAKLRGAKDHLEKASHDHGGFRSKALHHVKEAIAETEHGIEWARTHPAGH